MNIITSDKLLSFEIKIQVEAQGEVNTDHEDYNPIFKTLIESINLGQDIKTDEEPHEIVDSQNEILKYDTNENQIKCSENLIITNQYLLPKITGIDESIKFLKHDIGKSITIITPVNIGTNEIDEGLIEFAKSQGFDEEAINLILGKNLYHSEKEDIKKTKYGLNELKFEPLEIINNEKLTNNQLIQLNIIEKNIQEKNEQFSLANIKLKDVIDTKILETELHNNDQFLKIHFEHTNNTGKNDIIKSKDVEVINIKTDTSEKGDEICNRLGYYIANRLIKDVERGNWDVQLQLEPKDLGMIDIKLQMHERKLDAQFYTNNSYTQHLLQEGLQRLKESVGNSGIELASTWIGGNGSNAEHQHHGYFTQSNQSKMKDDNNANLTRVDADKNIVTNNLMSSKVSAIDVLI